MSVSKPTIVLFSEFRDIIGLTKIVDNEANIQVCTPFNDPQPDYITRNIKIFYPPNLDRNDAERLAQKLSNKLIANNFATFVTDQLVYTDPEKGKILAPKDRIILEISINCKVDSSNIGPKSNGTLDEHEEKTVSGSGKE